MEACYAEGSKICYNSIPEIPAGQLAHQNCIRRDRIVAPTSDDSGQSFGLAPPAAAIYQYMRHPPKKKATAAKLRSWRAVSALRKR
jgi:hypothetical protein